MCSTPYIDYKPFKERVHFILPDCCIEEINKLKNIFPLENIHLYKKCPITEQHAIDSGFSYMYGEKINDVDYICGKETFIGGAPKLLQSATKSCEYLRDTVNNVLREIFIKNGKSIIRYENGFFNRINPLTNVCECKYAVNYHTPNITLGIPDFKFEIGMENTARFASDGNILDEGSQNLRKFAYSTENKTTLWNKIKMEEKYKIIKQLIRYISTTTYQKNELIIKLNDIGIMKDIKQIFTSFVDDYTTDEDMINILKHMSDTSHFYYSSDNFEIYSTPPSNIVNMFNIIPFSKTQILKLQCGGYIDYYAKYIKYKQKYINLLHTMTKT